MNDFFVFEGLDGCGKSTQIKMLSDHLESRGLACRCLHFPRTTGFFGQMIARFLRGEFGNASEVPVDFVALLYAGDRADATDDIRKWRRQSTCVIADRYVYSNMAFQAAKVDNEQEKRHLRNWIENLEFEHNGIERPDLSIYLHVPFEFIRGQLSRERDGPERKYLNGKEDIHESSLTLQRRVEAEYLSLCSKREDMVLVNCARDGQMLSADEIHEQVLDVVPL